MMTTAGKNFDDAEFAAFNANLIGLWDFLTAAPGADTGLDDGIAQSGTFYKGAAAAQDETLVTEGRNDQRFEVTGDSSAFDLIEGTIIARFSQFSHSGSKPDSLITCGNYADRHCDGFLDIRVTAHGAVEVYHIDDGAEIVSTSSDGFFSANDDVELHYAWSDTGGALKVTNHTTGAQEQIEVSDPMGLAIDDDGDASFVFGARAKSDNVHDGEFDGAIHYVAIYDANVVAALDGIVEGTENADVIDLAYTGDPEGDRIDNGDAILPGQGPDDDIVDALAGDDLIRSEVGDDTVYAGAGNDTVFGGTENDVIYGDSNYDGSANPAGADADDTLYGESGDDYLYGEDGDDFLAGGAGKDHVYAGDGDDTLSGDNMVAGDEKDRLSGEFGDDTFVDIGVGDIIDGGEDADGNDIDVLDLTGAGEAVNPGGGYVSVQYDALDPEAGTVNFLDAGGNQTGTATFTNIEQVIGVPICFTPGTVIATPKGERLVESLSVGDRVITRDNGIQEIRWVGKKRMSGAAFAQTPHLRPVRIKAGSLGEGLPERDMMLSPNHRVLVADDMTSVYFEDCEVLVAAKHLAGLPGIDVVDVAETTYFHLLFDNHEVILSDGAWTESFQPGDYSMAGLGTAQRSEIYQLFPELETDEGLTDYTAARRALKRFEARVLFS